MIEHYLWVNKLEPFCLTIAVGANLSSVERAFQIIPQTQKLTLVSEYWETFGKDDEQGCGCVQINTIGSAVVTFESNGWAGVATYDNPSILSQINCPTYVSIYTSINADMSFVYAKDGILIRQFDPLLYDAEGALSEEATFTWGLAEPTASAFCLAEKLTGIVVTKEWLLGQRHPTYKTLFQH